MCGIAGVLTRGGVDSGLLRRMGGTIAHRGPDDEGLWCDGDAGIGLAHRRLAIVDLSSQGHQPMSSADGRWQIVFNGEIYNHRTMRRLLEGEGSGPAGGWRGHSDTETLLQAVSVWGLHQALERSTGMFAIALWDRQSRELHLIRDRFGEKPLYYGWAGSDVVFGSELKAIRCHPDFQGDIDRESLSLYASRGYVPAPRSIYRHIYKVEPGCILTIDHRATGAPPAGPPSETRSGCGLIMRRYWSYRDVVTRGVREPIKNEQEAVERLEDVLGHAVREQSLADVPVGAFLSGGIDSSAIVALYQRHSSRPVHSYTIGFTRDDFDEAPHARRVADHLGTVHHEHYVGSSEALDVIPQLPTIYDEPFADSSQIPTFLVSRFARKEVTVALTGDGGDELFGGYNRHVTGPRLWRALKHVPRPLRAAAAAPLTRLPARVWEGLSSGPRAHAGARIAKALKVVATADGLHDLYGSFIDEWRFLKSPVIGGESVQPPALDSIAGCPDAMQLMYADATGYLPDDILHKVDRAAMAVSLETRVPFLDHRVAELAARIPLGMKIRGRQGKWIVRELLARHFPRNLFDRPKAGFAVPVGEWIRGPLRPWTESLLDPTRMRSDGFFDVGVVQHRWKDHLSGRHNSTAAIWAILMFQAWLDQQQASEAAAAA